MNLKSFFILLAGMVVMSACNRTASVASHAAKKDCSHVHWSYHHEASNPAYWADLCSGYSACGGKVQSPVNIATDAVVESASAKKPAIAYTASPFEIVNNGHTVQFNINGNNTATLNGKKYKLLQFHFHSLSEHTVNGKHFPAEVHFVHKYSDNDLAVIGVMIKEGKENPLLAKYLAKFPATEGKYKTDDLLNPADFLPADLSYYHYNGSLTTPPCSEVVSWYVLKTPVEASKAQLKALAGILHDNYRPTQPLNGRKITASE